MRYADTKVLAGYIINFGCFSLILIGWFNLEVPRLFNLQMGFIQSRTEHLPPYPSYFQCSTKFFEEKI